MQKHILQMISSCSQNIITVMYIPPPPYLVVVLIICCQSTTGQCLQEEVPERMCPLMMCNTTPTLLFSDYPLCYSIYPYSVYPYLISSYLYYDNIQPIFVITYALSLQHLLGDLTI